MISGCAPASSPDADSDAKVGGTCWSVRMYLKATGCAAELKVEAGGG